jgi:hypothetical protein
MCGGSPSAPTPPPIAPEAPTTPEARTPESTAAADRRRRAAAGSDGGRSTILTGPRGVQDGAATAQKTLLGE